ncbi:11151_t:CDS:2, partial [Entrophospora sp. SA101]
EEKNYQQFLNQLGPDSLASLCKLAESCHFNLSSQGVQGDIVGDSRATDSANDDGIPELVENSEAASEKKEIAKASSATTEKLLRLISWGKTINLMTTIQSGKHKAPNLTFSLGSSK